MTENEAIERLKCMRLFMRINDKASESKFSEEDYIANEMAIKAIEEIHQYRAIGTVGRFQQLTKQFKPHVTDKTSCPHRGCNKCDMYRKENEKYHEIGTVEECREARERQRVKDIIHNPDGGVDEDWLCPTCGKFCSPYFKHCQHCGQSVKVGENP